MFTPVYYPHVAARLPAVALKALASNSIQAQWWGCSAAASSLQLPASLSVDQRGYAHILHLSSAAETEIDVFEEK